MLRVATALLLTTACAHRVPVAPPVDVREPRWSEWASRVEALPVCVSPELEAASPEAPSLAPGNTVHVRGRLAVIEFDCSGVMVEYLLQGLWGPDPNALLTLREVDDAVARTEHLTCGSVLGVRAGGVEFAIEPLEPVRVWRTNDAELFDSLLAQTEAVVVGVVEASTGRQGIVQPTRACRAPGPSLELPRLPEGGARWKLRDGLEYLSYQPGVSRMRRAQAVRALYDVCVRTDPACARRAAERLSQEFGERARLGPQ